MKNSRKSLFGVLGIVALAFILGSCGNKQKAQQQQAQPEEAVIETETVVVEVDSVAPDTAQVAPQNNTPKTTPKK